MNIEKSSNINTILIENNYSDVFTENNNETEIYYQIKIFDNVYIFISTYYLFEKNYFLMNNNIKNLVTINATNIPTPEYIDFHYFIKESFGLSNNNMLFDIITNSIKNNENIMIHSKYDMKNCIKHVMQYLISIHNIDSQTAYKIIVDSKKNITLGKKMEELIFEMEKL